MLNSYPKALFVSACCFGVAWAVDWLIPGKKDCTLASAALLLAFHSLVRQYEREEASDVS